MYHAVYGFGIFIQLFHLLVITQGQCPEYFRYFRNETTGEMTGIVEIPRPPHDVPLHLRVVLSVAMILPTKYVGRIELEKPREESMRLILQGMPIYYRIHFPCQNPIPLVMSITLNDVSYCTGPPAIGVLVTNLILEHTLYPPRVILPLTEQLLNFISHQANSSSNNVTPKPSSDKRPTLIVPDENELPTTTTTTTTITTAAPSHFQTDPPCNNSKPLLDFTCGFSSNSNPIIGNGEAVTSGMWPWLAAIFIMKDELEFKCNGNLISRQYVLTVAHCFKEEGENVPPSMMLVSLGRINLYDWNDEESVNVDVLEYKVHPDYVNPLSADADLGIIKLMERVEYTPKIRPLCLWMGKADLESVVGKSGYVVGWQSAQQNRRQTSQPRISKVPIVSQEDCLRSNLAFVDATSNRTFCAGRRNGSGPCIGSSGSGLVMLHARLSRYHLRGIVSLSTVDAKTRFCDFKEYVVYVDIPKYLSWIHQEMMP